MKADRDFKLTGVALPKNAANMLDKICEHFIEHAEVRRTADFALLKSKLGAVSIRMQERKLLIELVCPSEEALLAARTSIAEHMFYFAGDNPLELTWSEPPSRAVVSNLHEARVVDVENVTPHMRRVKFSCADVSPFIGGDMHVRILMPPKGRPPVWPGYRRDGRLAWPDGEDELQVRAYTIRAVDIDRRQLLIDFFQHAVPGLQAPGADFARDARPGDVVALLGPGGGSLPSARSILLIGDESALPAIARIAAEAPADADMRAIIEVLDVEEEQPLRSNGRLEVRWLHRSSYPAGATGVLTEEAKKAITSADAGTFVWAACEKQDARSIRSFLSARRYDRSLMYVAWYWER